MKTYNEKCDKVLSFLKDNPGASLESFYTGTKIKRDDAIIAFLKTAKGFIRFNEHHIYLSPSGLDFISKTSFVEQREKV